MRYTIPRRIRCLACRCLVSRSRLVLPQVSLCPRCLNTALRLGVEQVVAEAQQVAA